MLTKKKWTGGGRIDTYRTVIDWSAVGALIFWVLVGLVILLWIF